MQPACLHYAVVWHRLYATDYNLLYYAFFSGQPGYHGFPGREGITGATGATGPGPGARRRKRQALCPGE